jgi:hypothetical protein
MYCFEAASVSISEISSWLNFIAIGGSSLAWGSDAGVEGLLSAGRWKSGHDVEAMAGMMGLRVRVVRVGAGFRRAEQGISLFHFSIHRQAVVRRESVAAIDLDGHGRC